MIYIIETKIVVLWVAIQTIFLTNSSFLLFRIKNRDDSGSVIQKS